MITSIYRHGPAVAAAVVLSLSASAAFSQSAGPQRVRPAEQPARLDVARLGFVEGGVEVRKGDGPWVSAVETQALAVGDAVRTLRGGTARLDFPWTSVAVGDGSEVSLGENRVLTLELERGRVDIDPEQTLLRVVTAEASISGSGRTLVRREGTTTFVASNNGGAMVEAQKQIVRLGVSKGTLVNKGAAPSPPSSLAPAPQVVSPSGDPRYVRPGETVHLVWKGREPAYHVEVLSIDSDVPVLSLDVDAPDFKLGLDWLGTFRWRVSGRTGPVETQPSGEGLICVVEK